MTVEDLKEYLVNQYKTYVINPEIFIRPIRYRPIRVYVGGEVKRPGYYTLSGVQSITKEITGSQISTVDSSSA